MANVQGGINRPWKGEMRGGLSQKRMESRKKREKPRSELQQKPARTAGLGHVAGGGKGKNRGGAELEKKIKSEGLNLAKNTPAIFKRCALKKG